MTGSGKPSDRSARHARCGWPQCRRGQSARRERLDALTRVAVRAFRSRGYRQTSVDDIAADLGITKRTLYQYVRSKEDLLFACCSRGLDDIERAVGAVAEAEGPARSRLLSVLRHYLDAVMSDYGWCMIHAEDQHLGPGYTRLINARKVAIDRGLRRLVEAGVDDGSIAPCDVKLTTFAIAGALNWIPQWYERGRGLAPVGIADRILNIFESGLSPRLQVKQAMRGRRAIRQEPLAGHGEPRRGVHDADGEVRKAAFQQGRARTTSS